MTWKKYLAAFAAAFLLQMWFDIAAYAANHKVYVAGLFVGFTYPFIAMVPMILILEAPTVSLRLRIAFFEGLGYMTATGVFLFVRDWS